MPVEKLETYRLSTCKGLVHKNFAICLYSRTFVSSYVHLKAIYPRFSINSTVKNPIKSSNAIGPAHVLVKLRDGLHLQKEMQSILFFKIP